MGPTVAASDPLVRRHLQVNEGASCRYVCAVRAKPAAIRALAAPVSGFCRSNQSFCRLAMAAPEAAPTVGDCGTLPLSPLVRLLRPPGTTAYLHRAPRLQWPHESLTCCPGSWLRMTLQPVA